MATLALNLVGLYAGSGGFTNSFVLGAAGLLFGGNKQVMEGPRQRDLSPPSSRVGNPIAKVFGVYPVVCDIIWSERIDEDSHEESAGGKGSGPTIVTYEYYATFAALICEGPIKRIRQIRLNDRLVWDYNGGDEKGKEDRLGKKKGGSFFTYNAATGTYTSNNGKVRLRVGTDTQLPDASEEADKGVGKTPAYRGRAVIHFDELEITGWGGRIPQVTVLVEEHTTNVSTIADWALSRAGIPSGSYETCELAGDHLTGLVIDESIPAREVLNRLGTAFQCDFPERDFVIRALKRGRTSGVTIPYLDMRTHDAGSEPPDAVWSRDRERSFPHMVEVSHLDAARQWTVNNAPNWSESAADEGEKLSIDLSSLSLSNPQARSIAAIERHRLKSARVTATLALPPKYAYLATGDVVTATIANTTHDVVISESQESLFGVLSYAAIKTDADDYAFPLTGDGEGLPPGIVIGTNNTYFAIIDTNSTADNLNDQQRLYIAACVPYGSTLRNFNMMSFAWESDDDDDLGQETPLEIPHGGTLGRVVGVLPPHPCGPLTGGPADAIYDETNTITVDLFNGALYNVTDAELLAGANRAIVGNEIVRFGKATFIETRMDGTKRYALTHLVRGDRGTDYFMATHAEGEAFVMVDRGIVTAKYKRGYINQPFAIRAIQGEMETFNIAVQPLARNLWPYSPYNSNGTRDGSNNLTVTWSRRSRYNDSAWWITGTLPILGETTEKYDIEFLNSSGVVVRAVAGLSSPTYTYTAANQTADGLTAGDMVRGKIYQISEAVGRGYPHSFYF
jgi:hypothetical protein